MAGHADDDLALHILRQRQAFTAEDSEAALGVWRRAVSSRRYGLVQAPARGGPTRGEQQAAAQPDPRALQWAQTNSWFGQDAAKTGAAYAIDAQLKMEGYNPSSEEYYSELDRRLEDAFPVMKKEVKPPKQVVASVSRGQSAPKKVSLTPNQLAMAKRLGVPPTEYAKFVRNTNDQ